MVLNLVLIMLGDSRRDVIYITNSLWRRVFLVDFFDSSAHDMNRLFAPGPRLDPWPSVFIKFQFKSVIDNSSSQTVSLNISFRTNDRS